MYAAVLLTSIMAIPLSAAKIFSNTPAFTQSRYLLKTVFHLPNSGVKSRYGLPVRAIHNTASRNSQLFMLLHPRSVTFTKQ